MTRPGGYTVIGDVKAYHAFDAFNRWKNDYWNQMHGGDPFWREYASTNLADMALQCRLRGSQRGTAWVPTATPSCSSHAKRRPHERTRRHQPPQLMTSTDWVRPC